MRKVLVSSGDAAFRLLCEPSLEQQWRDLYQACPWATAYQSPDFVKIWYDTYSDQFVPVILTMFDEFQTLSGMLTVAINKATSELVYAGDTLAEYQVWLARPDTRDSFICEALAILQEHWPRQVLTLKFLPPSTPLTWLPKSISFKRKCILTPSSRPLLGLVEEDVNRALKSRQRGLKGLKQLGTVSFSKIGRDEFPEIFDRVWPLYEFRQIGQYNCHRSRSDRSLKSFYLAMAARSDLLHMTVLRVDDTIVAWLVGTRSNGYFHPLAFGHSPFHARHSPCVLLFLMSAQLLLREEKRVFDLTPGGDAYKEKLAKGRQDTHTLYFFPGLRSLIEFKLTHELAKKAVRKLLRVGFRQPFLSLSQAIRSHRGHQDAVASGNMTKSGSDILFTLYQLNNDPNERIRCSDKVQKNEISELLNYKSSAHGVSLRDFLIDAQRFIDMGANLYTLSENDRLVASCWLVPGNVAAPANTPSLSLPSGTPLLVGFYAHPDGDAAYLLRLCVARWISEINQPRGEAQLILALPASDVKLNEYVSRDNFFLAAPLSVDACQNDNKRAVVSPYAV